MHEQGRRPLATHRHDDVAALADQLQSLHGPIIGLATAVRVCGHHLSSDAPDLDEVRMLVAEMVEVADRTIAILRR